MKMKNLFRLLFQFLFILFLASCATTESSRSDSGAPATSEERGSRSGRSTDIDRTRPLISHLRQLPGLTITPSGNDFRIQLRGNQSFTAPSNVMFSVNGVTVGTSYTQTASLFSMENVREIRLYNSAQALGRYGDRGAYGVIEITTN